MDEATRIRALHEQGRIDDAQARRLLAALGAVDADDSAEGGAAPAAAGSAPAAPGAGGTDAAAPDPAGPEAQGTSAHGASATGTDASGSAVAEVRAWARIELFAGRIDVEVDPTLDAPVAEVDDGEVEVTTTDGGWRIGLAGRNEGGWLERIVDGVRRLRVRIRVPADTGVHLDVKAGDVALRGVPALRGRLVAGDLEARGLRAVDVAVDAGDLDLRLDPRPGRHRVRMTAGDAEIRLPGDASVSVQGRVNVGDASAPAPFRTERSGIADRVTGTLGAGAAELSIDLVTGDLDLKVD